MAKILYVDRCVWLFRHYSSANGQKLVDKSAFIDFKGKYQLISSIISLFGPPLMSMIARLSIFNRIQSNS